MERQRLRRLAARALDGRCAVCNVVITYQGNGRPRVRCGAPQCEFMAEAGFEASFSLRRRCATGVPSAEGAFGRPMGDGEVTRALRAAGFAPGEWAMEAPLPRGPIGVGADLDPLMYGFGWDAAGFVEEFGRSGPDVGQTRLLVGATLGSTPEPIEF